MQIAKNERIDFFTLNIVNKHMQMTVGIFMWGQVRILDRKKMSKSYAIKTRPPAYNANHKLTILILIKKNIVPRLN